MAHPMNCVTISTFARSGWRFEFIMRFAHLNAGVQTVLTDLFKPLGRVAAWGVMVWVLALPAGCGGGGADKPAIPVVPSGGTGRVLSISAMPRLDPFPTTPQAYVDLATEAFDLAYSAGARGQMSTATWRELEPGPAGFDAQKMHNLQSAIAQSQRYLLTQFVGIQLVNTTARELPSDLATQPFDSPLVKARFRALLDSVIPPNRGKIKYLSIGNEVDAYLRAHPAEWAAYKRFYQDAAQYARTLDPAIKVGVTGTADGALTQSPVELQDLNADSDVLILTYYPLQHDAHGAVTVREPGVVGIDMPRMLTLAGARPLVLQEVGYPASALNNSSPALQAAFVTQVFAAWQQAGDRVPFLNVFMLHDFTQAMCDDFAVYYQLPGLPSFNAFLCSLGLRTASGAPRAAWGTLLDEVRKSGLN